MNNNDNSVNIQKSAYHHGDLRSALISEGLRLLAERDADSLSLREVARNVGVTATSVYRHFPDKVALMTALAREGLARLAAAQHAAADSAESQDAFAATGRAYVRFALANPALFRLIFSSALLVGEKGHGPDEPEAMTFLRQNAAAVIDSTIDDPAAMVQAVHAWSLVHGLAMLMLDGQIPVDDTLIDRVIAPAVSC